MPLPTPNTDESRDDFISRCMGNDKMVEEFSDTSQRNAVCQSQFDKSYDEAIPFENIHAIIFSKDSYPDKEDVLFWLGTREITEPTIKETFRSFVYIRHELKTFVQKSFGMYPVDSGVLAVTATPKPIFSVKKDIQREKPISEATIGDWDEVLHGVKQTSMVRQDINEFFKGYEYAALSKFTDHFPLYRANLFRYTIKHFLEKGFIKNVTNYSYWDEDERVPPVFSRFSTGDEIIEGLEKGILWFELSNKERVRLDLDLDNYGLNLTYLGTSQIAIESIQNAIEEYIKENNFLKGKKLLSNGTFIQVPNLTWEDIIIESSFKEKIYKNVVQYMERIDEFAEKGVPTKRGILLYGPPGCLDGNTEVYYRRGKRNSGRWITLKNLYEKFNGINTKWDLSISTQLQSYTDDETVIWNDIEAVFDSGEKECLELVTTDGYSIIGTPNHPILNEYGLFKELQYFEPGKKVLLRGSMKPLGITGNTYFNSKRKMIWTSKFHQILPLHKTIENNKEYYYNRISFARCVVESYMNNISVDEYINILKNDETAAKDLKYIQDGFDIHHIDEDPSNDTLDNLLVLSHENHAKLHAKLENFNIDYTTIGEVKDIKNIGIRHTYDIQMKDPNNNFVTKGFFFAHNTGKTLMGKVLANTIPGTFIWVPFGASYKHVYDMARELAPSVVLLEDLASHGGLDRRGHEGSSGQLSVLLNMLDGVEENDKILTLATENYVDHLDVALRNRPGRFDVLLKMDYPEVEQRVDLLQKLLPDFAASRIYELAKGATNMSFAHLRELATRLIIEETTPDGDMEVLKELQDTFGINL